MSEKKKYGQIYMDGMPGYCVPIEQLGILGSELEECEVGQGFEVKLMEMTEKEFENAPEFEGW